jgi:hypothetical protein
MLQSGQLNEFVLISRVESGAYVVVYGPRDDERIRHFRGGFRTAEEAVEWVETLDRLVAEPPPWRRRPSAQATAGERFQS